MSQPTLWGACPRCGHELVMTDDGPVCAYRWCLLAERPSDGVALARLDTTAREGHDKHPGGAR